MLCCPAQGTARLDTLAFLEEGRQVRDRAHCTLQGLNISMKSFLVTGKRTGTGRDSLTTHLVGNDLPFGPNLFPLTFPASNLSGSL